MEVNFKEYSDKLLSENKKLAEENTKLKQEVKLLTDINLLICSFNFDKVYDIYNFLYVVENREEFIDNLKDQATKNLLECGKHLIEHPEDVNYSIDSIISISARVYKDKIYLDLEYNPVSANNYE